MIEVLWHGRGGQGAFTAARLLGAAASMAEGSYALAFPSFGPERRGAPMRAFTKMSPTPIGDRSAITRADYVVYLDDTLLSPGWDKELKPGGTVLVNSAKSVDDLLRGTGCEAADASDQLLAIDASGISTALLGRPIPNTAFLGALSLLCDQVPPDAVAEAVRQYMPAKLHEKNLAIIDEARHATAQALAARAGVPSASAPAQVGVPSAAEPLRASAVAIPRLREDATSAPSLEPRDFAQSTCYPAGHLVTRNAGWRNQRPVLDPTLCTGCLQCYLYCPDGTIVCTGATKDQLSASDSAIAAVAVDYDFCKGCGICAKVCRFDALAMIPEEEARAAEAAAAQASDAPSPVAACESPAVPLSAGSPAAPSLAGSSAAPSSASATAAAGEALTSAFLSDYESEGGAR